MKSLITLFITLAAGIAALSLSSCGSSTEPLPLRKIENDHKYIDIKVV